MFNCICGKSEPVRFVRLPVVRNLRCMHLKEIKWSFTALHPNTPELRLDCLKFKLLYPIPGAINGSYLRKHFLRIFYIRKTPPHSWLSMPWRITIGAINHLNWFLWVAKGPLAEIFSLRGKLILILRGSLSQFPREDPATVTIGVDRYRWVSGAFYLLMGGSAKNDQQKALRAYFNQSILIDD